MCQPSSLPDLGGRALTRAANRTPQPNLVYRCTTGGRPHPSHPAFPFARRAGDLPETPPRFFFHNGRGTYPSPPRHPCHTERRVPSLPAPSPDNRNLRVSCVLAQELAHICPLLFCDLLHHFALFFLITECSCPNVHLRMNAKCSNALPYLYERLGESLPMPTPPPRAKTPLHVANLPSDRCSATNPSFKPPQHASRPVGYAKRSHAINQPSLHL